MERYFERSISKYNFNNKRGGMGKRWKKRDGEREKETDRQTDRQTDGWRERKLLLMAACSRSSFSETDPSLGKPPPPAYSEVSNPPMNPQGGPPPMGYPGGPPPPDQGYPQQPYPQPYMQVSGLQLSNYPRIILGSRCVCVWCERERERVVCVCV